MYRENPHRRPGPPSGRGAVGRCLRKKVVPHMGGAARRSCGRRPVPAQAPTDARWRDSRGRLSEHRRFGNATGRRFLVCRRPTRGVVSAITAGAPGSARRLGMGRLSVVAARTRPHVYPAVDDVVARRLGKFRVTLMQSNWLIAAAPPSRFAGKTRRGRRGPVAGPVLRHADNTRSTGRRHRRIAVC